MSEVVLDALQRKQQELLRCVKLERRTRASLQVSIWWEEQSRKPLEFNRTLAEELERLSQCDQRIEVTEERLRLLASEIARTMEESADVEHKQSDEESINVYDRVIDLSRFVMEYRNHSETVHQPTTQKTVTSCLKEFLRIVGNKTLESIQTREIDHFFAEKKSECSDITLKKYYSTLSSTFAKAKAWRYISVNPFLNVQKPRAPERQPAHLTRDEFSNMLQTIAEDNFKDLCLAGGLTGMRQGELRSLRWNNVDFERRLIHVSNSKDFTTKSKKNRDVPLHPMLFEALAKRKPISSCEWVFDYKDKMFKREMVSRKFKSYVRAAKLSDELHFHSLRHSFATWLVEDGVPIYEVKILMGHSSMSVTEGYAHLATSNLHSAINGIRLDLNQQ